MPTDALRTLGRVGAKNGPIISARQLTIGTETFDDEEHPSTLKFAMKSTEAVHEYIGGTKSSQNMGVYYEPITWGGNLWAGNVLQRISNLKTITDSGKEQRLKFLLERYDVKVTAFDWTYHHRWWAEYTITVEPLRSISGNGPSRPSVGPSVDAQSAQLASNASSSANTVVIYDASSLADELASTTTATTQAVNSNLPLSQSSGVPALLAMVNANLTKAQSYLAALPPGVVPAHFVASLSVVNSLTLLSKNIASGQSTKTQNYSGGDLATIAATTTGDPSLFGQIATANGVLGDILPPNVRSRVALPPIFGVNV